MAVQAIETTGGKIYNLGGGPDNKMCLHDLIATLEGLTGRKLQYAYDDWRPGDQPVFVCNVEKARQEFGWEPRVAPEEGVTRLYEWVSKNKQLFLQEGL